jgi:acetoin utilization protein AcuB
MLVGQRMSHNPITIGPDMPISEALEKMRREKVRRFPVLDKKGKMVGIVAEADLLYASPSPVTSLSVWEVTYLLSHVTVREVMTKDVLTVCEDCPIEDAARMLRDNKVGGLPVMRDGTLVGIITESDLFDVFLELFMAREAGVRLTVIAPYYKGAMAKILSAIADRGGLVHAANNFLGSDPTNWGLYVRVADLSKEELLEAVEPLVLEVVDVREV